MKFAVMTDIHANLEAFEACIADAAGQGVTRHAVLGDFVGYGADPQAVVRRAIAWLGPDGIAVKGNHDAAAAGDNAVLDGMNDHAAAAIRWTRQALDADAKRVLSALPLTAAAGGALLVHADARRPEAWGYVTTAAEAERALRAVPERVVLSGHVHATTLWQMHEQRPAVPFAPVPGRPVPLLTSRRWLAVIGAVGQPRDGDPRATYAIYDSDAAALTIRRVPYDVESAAAKIRRAGLPPRLADRLLRGQ
jgi:diadenosine tetraphosphatase ApaH/serine/threonine PP2A family protein phosphatase